MILVITSAATRSEINTAINKVIAKCEYSIIIPQDMDTEKRITKALKSLNAEVLFQISFSENFRNFVTTKNVTYLDLATCTRHFSDFNKAQYDFIMNLESCSVNALAGTGKTYAITYAAVNLIVKCKCTVEQLCFVTFTREATKEINNRFSKVLEAYGQICNNKVIRDALCNNGSKKAFTIDSLFFQILKEVGTDIGISKNIKIRNDDRDIDKIISDVVEAEFGRERAQKLRPVGKHAHNHYLLVDSGFFAKDFISFIKGILYNSSFDYYSFRYSNDFKRNNIFDYVELNLKGEVVRDSNVGNILNKLVKECILRITSLTEERILRDQTISLKAVQFYLLMCKDKFKECDFIQKLKYLFIDENQDCSPIQLHLINEIKLANRDCKFVHIGDGNQAIYSFRMGKSSAMEAVSYLPGIQFKYKALLD